MAANLTLQPAATQDVLVNILTTLMRLETRVEEQNAYIAALQQSPINQGILTREDGNEASFSSSKLLSTSSRELLSDRSLKRAQASEYQRSLLQLRSRFGLDSRSETYLLPQPKVAEAANDACFYGNSYHEPSQHQGDDWDSPSVYLSQPPSPRFIYSDSTSDFFGDFLQDRGDGTSCSHVAAKDGHSSPGNLRFTLQAESSAESPQTSRPASSAARVSLETELTIPSDSDGSSTAGKRRAVIQQQLEQLRCTLRRSFSARPPRHIDIEDKETRHRESPVSHCDHDRLRAIRKLLEATRHLANECYVVVPRAFSRLGRAMMDHQLRRLDASV